jgi:hypothetical protein
MAQISKTVALTLGLLACGGLGLLAALVWQPETGVKEATLLRVHNGVTERGRIVAVTTAGHIRRVMVWRTKDGVETQTVDGPLRVRTMIDSPTSLAPVARQPLRTSTVTLPPETLTRPAETLIQTVTQTVAQVTVTAPVGTTVVETVTETVTESGSP